MSKRRTISTTERVKIFKANNGVCHMCNQPIKLGELWEASHDIPLELGGEDKGDNLKPAHKTCHRVQTSTVDIPAIAKAKRREAKNLGAVAPKQPIPAPVRASTAKEPCISKTPLQPRAMYR